MAEFNTSAFLLDESGMDDPAFLPAANPYAVDASAAHDGSTASDPIHAAQGFHAAPIAFDLTPTGSIHADPHAKLSEVQQLHTQRAARFAIPVVQAKPSVVWNPTDYAKQRYANKAGTFSTGIDLLAPAERQKIEDRAKRFGKVSNVTSDSLKQEEAKIKRAQKFGQLSAMASNDSGMDVDAGAVKFEPSAAATVRFDAVYMYGTDQMSSGDVLKYFGEYGPAFVEWINDSSCNVVWEDTVSAGRALLGLSVSPSSIALGIDPLIQAANDGVPPSLEWRRGVASAKASDIYLRFATSEDVKRFGAANESVYYQLHGRPNAHPKKRFHSQQNQKPHATAKHPQQQNQHSQQQLQQNDAAEGTRAAGRRNRKERAAAARDNLHNTIRAMTTDEDNALAVSSKSGEKSTARGCRRWVGIGTSGIVAAALHAAAASSAAASVAPNVTAEPASAEFEGL
ncbi:hypothetical protein CAOG_03515 [Capsaspora owczarzaki ATCC 30864]|uniref:Nuclear cap-binding protein subunit 3 n=1 Tax=Capsaspora owczarzaki (strain ATCC 30864) TaxID=595528 RepID=A0A0D2WPI7_CAPO3|nr:hypothetical protein CAOG_03515 [Capsaspora owczarzaki ATCC 30864]KJE92573.1 hypothetical protein CAOG_003515 [Capsaspora owczarzaki ATCC 30864]|eukprot:XP_004348420.1 hypothetical protein CAOG_03515 [Capsaspora owczarzaki ATCC 30864]